jgi:hypothetical protein
MACRPPGPYGTKVRHRYGTTVQHGGLELPVARAPPPGASAAPTPPLARPTAHEGTPLRPTLPPRRTAGCSAVHRTRDAAAERAVRQMVRTRKAAGRRCCRRPAAQSRRPEPLPQRRGRGAGWRLSTTCCTAASARGTLRRRRRGRRRPGPVWGDGAHQQGAGQRHFCYADRSLALARQGPLANERACGTGGGDGSDGDGRMEGRKDGRR